MTSAPPGDEILRLAYYYAWKWRGTMDLDDAAQICAERMLTIKGAKKWLSVARVASWRALYEARGKTSIMPGATRVGLKASRNNDDQLAVDATQHREAMINEMLDYAHFKGYDAALGRLFGERPGGRRWMKARDQIRSLKERFCGT